MQIEGDGFLARLFYVVRETGAFLELGSLLEGDNLQAVLEKEAGSEGQNVMVIDEKATVPLMVLETDGSLRVIIIPHLSEFGFAFLREALDTYEPAIVIKAKHPSRERVIGPGDALPGEVEPKCTTTRQEGKKRG